MYVGSYSNFIFHLARDTVSDALTLVEAVAAHGLQPSFLTLSTDGKYLYAALEHGSSELTPAVEKSVSGAVAAFAVDAATGKLTFLNVVRSEGPWPCHVSFSKGFVAVANYGGGVALLGTAATGALVPATAGGVSNNTRPDRSADYEMVLPGQGNRQDESHSHSANFVANGSIVLVPDLGLDMVWAYRVEAATSSLVRCSPSPGFATADGEGPRHLCEVGSDIFVCCELSNKVYKLALDGTTGQITQTAVSAPTVPVLGEYAEVLPPCEAGAFNGEVSCCADIHVTVDRNFVAVSNRGADTITLVPVDFSGDASSWPSMASGGKTPRNFVVEEASGKVIVCNQNESSLRVFQSDGTSADYSGFGPEWKWPCCIVLGALCR